MNVQEKREFKRLQKSRLKAQSQGNLREEAEICNALGELLSKNGEYEEAIQEHKAELQISESLADVIGAAVANRKIGECYSELNRYDKALKYQNKHLELAESVSNHVEEQRALATIGRTYLCQADSIIDVTKEKASLQKAQESFLRSLRICDKLKGTISEKELQEMRARLFLNLGLVFDNQQDQENCVKFIKQAIFIAEKHKLFEDLFRAHFSLGGIYQKNNDNNKSLRCLEAAIRCAKGIKDKYMESEASVLSACTYFRLGDFTAAKHALRKAYKLGSRLPIEREHVIRSLKSAIKGRKLVQELDNLSDVDYESRMSVYESLGDLCCKVIAFSLGIKYYHKQLKCAIALQKPVEVLLPIFVSLAATYQDNKQYDKAVECYRKELELRQNNPKEDVKTWLNIALSQEDAQGDYTTLYKSYKEALECAERANVPKLQYAELYSVVLDAQGDYTTLYKSYKEALECAERANVPKLQFSPYLVKPLLDAQGDYTTLYKSYKEALECAERANVPKLQLRALKSLCLIQDKFNKAEMKEDTLERLSRLKEQCNLDSDDDMSGVDDTETQESSENVQIEELELSESDVSDCEEFDRSRARTNKFTKRNEKGETPLHRASIDGNFKTVQKLIEQGHPVNCRDYCGWLPLHEACNFGHYQIVEYLVDHGAIISDRGGQGCQGVTPLHDAINCGHFDIAKLLINRGATVYAKDDQGSTPLDTLLKWQETYKEDLDEETLVEVKDMKKLLRKSISPGQSRQQKSPNFDSLENTDLYDREQDDSDTMPSPRPTRPRHERHQFNAHRTMDASDKRRNSSGQKRDVVARRRNLLDFEDEDDYSDGARDEVDDASQNDVTMATLPSPTPHRMERPESDDEIFNIDSMDTEDESRERENVNTEVEESDELYRNPLIDNFTDFSQPENASSVYRDAIANMGSAARRTSSQTPQQRLNLADSDANQPALVAEDEYTGDDWLIDDMRQRPSKRKRIDIESVFRTSESTTQNITRNKTGNSSSTSRSLSLKNRSKRTKQMKLTSMTISTSRNVDNDAYSPNQNIANESDDDDVIIPTQPDRTVTNFQISNAVPLVTSSQSVTSTGAAPMRVRVKVQDKTFLIPVLSREKTISWLTEQSAQRYYNASGLRPNLVLMTGEGALFSPEDTVMDVMSMNEEIIGDVSSWDLQPLPERYQRACEAAGTDANFRIKEILASNHCSVQLAFKDLALTSEQVTPLFRSLQRQYSIKQLLLPGNCIKDAVISHLAAAIATMPNLSVLDLSCNQITHEGLKMLSESLEGPGGGLVGGDAISRNDKSLKMLEVLDLSYNSLSDSCTLYLAGIIKHSPLLSTLKLSSCDLTVKFFQLHRRHLQDALKGAAHLHTLMMSHNSFGPIGVELLLKCLSCDTMTSLDLSSTMPSSNITYLSKHLTAYLSQAGCALKHLNLGGCFLTNEDLMDITSCFSTNKCLSSLHLCANSKITNYGLQCLLDTLQVNTMCMDELDLCGCSLTSPIDTQFLTVFGRKTDSQFPLKSFRFSTNGLEDSDIERLVELWKDHHQKHSAWFRYGTVCHLYRKELS
ncbi:tonsoku-like protein [Glandiceps talaboti]